MGPRGRRRLGRHTTSARGSKIQPDPRSNSTNTLCPRRTVSQHTLHGPSHTGIITCLYFPSISSFDPTPRFPPDSSGPASFPLPADVFEDDISSCSSSTSTEQHGALQSPAFSSLQGLSGDQSLSDFPAVGPPLNRSPRQAQVRNQHTFSSD